MKKKNDKEPKDINDNIYSSREFGKFCIQCPFKYDDNYSIKNEKPNLVHKNGILILEFKTEEKMKEIEHDLKIEEI